MDAGHRGRPPVIGRLNPRFGFQAVAACAGAVAGLALLAAACSGSSNPPVSDRATRTDVKPLSPAQGELILPLRDGSVRFAVIGDSGRGDQAQTDVAGQMMNWRAKFPFNFVVMLGDNIYPPHTPAEYKRKFEDPYGPLLDAGVTFHAAIGNHDDPASVNYAPLNMDGKRYYTFRRAEMRLAGLTGAGVRFFVLDSRSFDSQQLEWLARELKQSESSWKIACFHHPLYTSGRYRAGARALRDAVERLLVEGDVDVVFSGHEHFYERVRPQHGITYFISGAGGALRPDDITPSAITAAGFDDDCHFIMIEVTGDELYFQVISRAGRTVDAGVIVRHAT
jgi:predicted phosphodiesterase